MRKRKAIARVISKVATDAIAQERTVECLPDEGFCRTKQIVSVLSISRSCWWSWVAAGRVPQPIKLSEMVSVWPVGQIRDLIARIERGEWA